MAVDTHMGVNRYKRYYQAIGQGLAKPATRAYTTVIFSFLVVSLFGWYAIRPTTQTIVTLQREIADKTDIDKKMEDKISALIEAQAAYQDVEPYVPIINQALPPSSDPVRAAAQLQSLAADSHITVNALSLSSIALTADSGTIGQKKSSNAVSDFPISMSVTGIYPDIITFIQGVLNLRRVMQIDSMVLSPMHTSEEEASASANPSGTQIKLDLKLNVFYL